MPWRQAGGGAGGGGARAGRAAPGRPGLPARCAGADPAAGGPGRGGGGPPTPGTAHSSVKEMLESSLFEAQQHSSQLAITRSPLEIQLHTVRQAKEVIQGEVKCFQCELEAERSLMRQEWENVAQQLLQTEQQCNGSLKLRQTEHEVEINELLQDLVLPEKEREKSALLETLLQTQGERREANQQLEQLRREVKEQCEDGQNITEELQAELQETQSKMQAVEKRHKEEIKPMKEEITVLLQQRDALQNQVEELTSQLAASEESQQVIGCKAQQDLSEAQELSRQKVLEVVTSRRSWRRRGVSGRR
ncbi:centrosome-associated protein CEP250-like isoform X5 [Athene noctua]|uniref:centrosome-associated protein CEP250-like isoform X5 n=1 Tax=Athene noctua TaxID=126797 RepID=UPI003EBB681A